MLAKQLAIGSTPASLVKYLYGAGRANEHENQRLIAGSERLTVAFGPLDVAHDSEAQAALAREFDGAWRQVRRERGLPLEVPEGEKVRGAARGDRVYHATLSLGTHEGSFTDAEWAKAARMFVAEMGFIDDKNGLADCAWMAVHHGSSKDGNDHVHIAVNLVREDGRRADIHQSKRRTAQAGARVAGAMGKDSVFDAEITSGIGNVSRAEYERAMREKRDADRVLVRRRLAGAAWQAGSEGEFVRTARVSGLLVRPRYEQGGLVKITGYSVALADTEKAIWFAPSKLDKSLGLRALREANGWDFDTQMTAVPVWRESARSKHGGDRLRLPVEDEIKRVRVTLTKEYTEIHWRPAAAEASKILGAWSVQAEGRRGGPLAKASDALAKAAQPPRRSGREAGVEAAVTIGAVVAASSKNDTAAQIAVIMQLMKLAEATARAAAAEKEAHRAREMYERAVVPLNLQAGMLRFGRSQEQLRALERTDPEAAEVLRITGGPGTRRPTGVDTSILDPETVAALAPQEPGRPKTTTNTPRPARARHNPVERGEGHER